MTPQDHRDWLTREEAERRFVSKDAYQPVEKLVYGVVGVLLLGVVTFLLKLVIRP